MCQTKNGTKCESNMSWEVLERHRRDQRSTSIDPGRVCCACSAALGEANRDCQDAAKQRLAVAVVSGSAASAGSRSIKRAGMLAASDLQIPMANASNWKNAS